MKKISQREAHRLKREVEAWKERWRGFTNFYPGQQITSCKWDAIAVVPVTLRTAQTLNHIVFARAEADGTVVFRALEGRIN